MITKLVVLWNMVRKLLDYISPFQTERVDKITIVLYVE